MEFCRLKKNLCKRGGCCGYGMHITGKKIDEGICPHAVNSLGSDFEIDFRDCYAKSKTTVIGNDERGKALAEVNKGIITRLGQ